VKSLKSEELRGMGLEKRKVKSEKFKMYYEK
jgi:hypothetical protein